MAVQSSRRSRELARIALPRAFLAKKVPMWASTWPDYGKALWQFVGFVVIPNVVAGWLGSRHEGRADAASTFLGALAGIASSIAWTCGGTGHLSSVWILYFGLGMCWVAAYLVARWLAG